MFNKSFVKFFVNNIQSNAGKIAECEISSNYIYPPLKYNFRRTVRTVSCILLAVKKFKLLLLRAKLKEGDNIDSKLDSLIDVSVKFRYFSLIQTSPQETLKSSFNVAGFVTNSTSLNQDSVVTRKYFCLTESDLSVGLEYLFKIGTREVERYVDKKKIDKMEVWRDDILYLKGRIMDELSLKAIGDLEGIVNVSEFIGFNFSVPILYRHSPLSLLIANHLHYNVLEHKGMESCYRLSLNHVHILQGRAVFRNVVEHCIKCKMLRKKY